jgi:ATP-dependent protease HslVU (ClpYQ) peptidase subunit
MIGVEMTCIVGIAENGKVYIGGDSAGVAGLDLTVRSDEKVFRNDEFLFGFTSSFRMGQLLRFSFYPPSRAEKMGDYKYLVTTFIDAVRSCLKTGGYATTKDGGEHGGTFLLGYRGKLYVVDSDYQVGSAADGFASVGCGDQVAHGSLFSTIGKSPRDRIETALNAAERFSAGVRGPFTILDVGDGPPVPPVPQPLKRSRKRLE